MQYWFPELSAWMPALSMLAILFLLNLLSVKMFGEAEFWFALIKVITIIASDRHRRLDDCHRLDFRTA